MGHKSLIGFLGTILSAGIVANISNPNKQFSANPVASYIIDQSARIYKKGIETNETGVVWSSEGPNFNPRSLDEKDLEAKLGEVHAGFNDNLKSKNLLIGYKSASWCAPCYLHRDWFIHLIDNVYAEKGVGGFIFNGDTEQPWGGEKRFTPENFPDSLRAQYGLDNLFTGTFPQVFAFKKGEREIGTIDGAEDLRKMIQEAVGIKVALPEDLIYFNPSGTSVLAYNDSNAGYILTKIAEDPSRVRYLPDPVSHGFLAWTVTADASNKKELEEMIAQNPKEDFVWPDYPGNLALVNYADENNLSGTSTGYSLPSQSSFTSYLAGEERRLREQYGDNTRLVAEFRQQAEKLRNHYQTLERETNERRKE